MNMEKKNEKARIVLQNLIYPSAENCSEEELFFRRVGEIAYILADSYVTMSQGARLLFDTYFNSFSAGKWFKYTNIKNVSLKLLLQGKFFITLYYKERQLTQIYSKIIKEVYCDTKGEKKEVTFDFDYEKNQGMYAFAITALENGSIYFGGEYYTEIEDNSIDDIGLGIVICTFKREKYIYKNMKLLGKVFWSNNNLTWARKKIFVYISDNAKTLNESNIENENVKIIRNKNVGGAGGFTRGLIECLNEKQKNKITHALLMDDDVMIQPESIYRTYIILSLLKDEYKDSYVGGAMLRLDKQWFQTESGSLWNGGMLISRKSGLDLRQVEACLYNEVEEAYDYNAWWYCTIPMSIVKEDNLPLPLFIRGDDVEYGLRNMKNLILMNGICVWHEPFEFKFSSSMFYYIFRNRLIDNSIHHIRYTQKQFWNDFTEQFTRELFTYRYKNAQLLLDGVNDFLKGIEWLKQQDGELLNQEIIKRGYQMQYISELEVPFDFPTYDRTIHMVEDKKSQLKRKILWNGMFLKPVGDAIVPTVDPHIAYFYRKDRVLNYDYTSQKGFVTKKDNKEFWRLKKELKKLKVNVKKKYNIIVQEYEKRGRELMNMNFWKLYLDIK